MIIELNGKTSHAAEPENGISPVLQQLPIFLRNCLCCQKDDFKNFTLVTIIHARIGEVAFGTSPGDAVVMATLRALIIDEMENSRSMAEALVREKALARET
jgi:metal-dependent amidase/aminoacylase/carboxypeptidase family protein